MRTEAHLSRTVLPRHVLDQYSPSSRLGPGPSPDPEIFLLPGPDLGPKISDMMNFS